MEQIKFVVWGAGHRCLELLGYLGADYVDAIIDEDIARQGTCFQQVPIISKEQYLASNRKCPVIVTPLNAETAIQNYLKENGVYWSFPYWGETRTEMGSFLVQAPCEDIIKDYDKSTGILIFGWSVLTLLMYNFFIAHGFSCVIMLPEKTDSLVKRYVEYDLEIQTVSEKSDRSNYKVLLASKPTELDLAALSRYSGEIESFYDITLRKELYHNAKLEAFRGIHEGERVFIVATGPSLQFADLDKLYENQEICISMNKIYKGFRYTSWRPDYYIAVDSAPITENKGNLTQCGKRGVFIGDLAWNLIEDSIKENLYKWHVYNWWDGERMPQFTDDFSKGSYWGMTITYDALQLAVYMGFSEIYLVGVDCCKYSNAESQHFVKDYSEKIANIREHESMISYGSARRYADAHGIKIYNATRGGKLEVFERVEFDSLF